MEEQIDLKIGNTESITLQAKPVKVISIEIRKVEIKGKQNEKLVAICKHPDREETIEISQVKYENKGKLVISGLWISKDKQGLLIKNSALAILLRSAGCTSTGELMNQSMSTIQDEKGYLTFKAY